MAISRYDLKFCCALRWMVPGDCHVASLLAMTSNIDTSPKKSSFLNKFFLTLWAGDGDLALSFRHPHRLTAPGTVKIPVFPILEPLQKSEILPVFLIPLVGVAG